MPHVILRPYLLSYKNRVFRGSRHSLVREGCIALISATLVWGAYSFLLTFLTRVRSEPSLALLPEKLLHLSVFAFFFLLVFSNFVSALGFFFTAKNSELLLTLPISPFRLYCARLLETLISSSWMLFLFAAPAIAAYCTSFSLSADFVVTALLTSIPLVLIPAAFGSICSTYFVNFVPIHRVRDLVAITAFFCVALILLKFSTVSASPEFEHSVKDVLLQTALMQETHPAWLPSSWISSLLVSHLSPVAAPLSGVTAVDLGHSTTSFAHWSLLWGTTFALLAFGFLSFEALFMRGWTLSITGSRVSSTQTPIRSNLLRVILPLPTQFRALAAKELKMFVRDTTQSLQLLLLLMLTFIYLYNFRSLQNVSAFSEQMVDWWRALLCITNITLGNCVVAAIATRFIYPTVSLEGRAFQVLRTTPLSLSQFLWNKFFIWICPVTVISVVLLVSGAFAISVPPTTVLWCAALGVAMSIGVVGLGVGVGAVYVKFDWDSPSEVSASFGSLVYMFLTLAVLFVSAIPAGILIILTGVPNFQQQLPRGDFIIATAASFLLVLAINVLVARRALASGEQSLRALES